METVIVAHGLWMPGFETALLRRRLRSAGFEPALFRFPTVSASLTENVARLGRFVNEQQGDAIHFVGHSLGGVVVTALVEGQSLRKPGRVVCLGSPLNGSESGRVLSRSRFGAALVGESIGELNRLGGLAPWSGTTELGVVAGSLALGAGSLFARLPPPHDGTVTVAETMLEGVTDHIVLPVTHTSMMFDRRVAAAAIRFLRLGSFADAAN